MWVVAYFLKISVIIILIACRFLTLFAGVHCTTYASVGKPELYLHERYPVLADTEISEEDRAILTESLENAVEGVPNVHIDISKCDLQT